MFERNIWTTTATYPLGHLVGIRLTYSNFPQRSQGDLRIHNYPEGCSGCLATLNLELSLDPEWNELSITSINVSNP